MDITEKLKVIIVATDFSAESDKAVDFAAALVLRNLDSTIYIIHAVREPFVPIGDAVGSSEIVMENTETVIKSTRERVERTVSKLKNMGISEVHGSVRMGDPVAVILDAIQEYNAGLVIMGTRKHGFAKGIFFGSVSERVSANSPVSVLVVR